MSEQNSYCVHMLSLHNYTSTCRHAY